MRPRHALLAAAVLGLVPGCLGATSPAPKPTRSVVPGKVVTESGVPGASGVPAVLPSRHAPIVVASRTAAGTRLVRRLRTDARGRFRLTLPPGGYTVAPSDRPPDGETIVATGGRPVSVWIRVVGL